jgi:gliding motility-associated-like protein
MAAYPGIKNQILTVILMFFAFNAKSQLTAEFSGTPIMGCAPLATSFTDQTTGSPTQWKWDLGNGTISYLQNPSVTYFTPGQYNVKLTAYNSNGDSSVIIKNQYVTIYALPVVAFTGTPLSGCPPVPVTFTDQSTAGSGTIALWQWDLGDGSFTTTQNPSHTYTGAGNYNITLRVVNSLGCSKVLSKPQYIKISSPVQADFSNSHTASCTAPFTVNFQNLSTGTGTHTYKWNFGDGSSSTLANPAHTYTAQGTYTVTLITLNSSGCSDTIVKTNHVSIGAFNAAITNPPSVCQGVNVAFTNNSTPTPNGAVWAMGDGNTINAINPTYTYNTPGVYPIRMIADFGGCFDTAYSSITVLSNPVANFTAINTTACKPPLTVRFTNTSTDAVSFNWNFGDGNTSTQRNPVHTYTTSGSFSVTLTVTNANGCLSTLIIPDFVRIVPPSVQINNLPIARCAPLTHTFSSTVNSVDPVIGYQWDFGDGSTSTLPNPTHTFAAGVYNIRLIITTAGGCTDTVTVNSGIIATVKPNPGFFANPRDVCAQLPVTFTDTSSGTITSWLWLFGDGGSSTSQNPTHIYEDTGYFDITLIICNGGCCDTLVIPQYIHISPPIAAFDFTFDCSKHKERVFIDQSIGADEWRWDFGDGSTSTLQNPTHTYADTGNYVVTLVVKNFTTGCEYTYRENIRVMFEKANYIVSDTALCRRNPILFTAIGNYDSDVASYEWDFGDGNTATGKTATHIYITTGSYTVQLIVTDLLGCKDTLTKPLYINIYGPSANFTPGVTGSCLLTAVPFTDNSTTDGTHPITNWIWSYGDGIIDTLSAPPFTHTYAGPGSYSIFLKVTDAFGCVDSITAPLPLIISDPVADYATLDTLTCPTKLVYFSNYSTGPNLTYLWDFGDGTTDNTATPQHAYAADGLYTIKLYITDQYGCKDSLIKPDYIRVVTPVASFTLSDSLSTCPPLLATFTNTSQNAIAVSWDFGDGTSTVSDNPSHFYNVPGTYFARLTVTSPGGCTSVVQKTIVVRGPLGTFTYNPLLGCNPLTVSFNAATQDRLSFIWDFNNGTTNSTTDSAVTYTYTRPGKYLPRMILVDSAGCVVPILGPDSITVNGVNANFGFVNKRFCDNEPVAFIDSSFSTENIASYAWTFGDGNTSALQNPSHLFAANGIYTPQLIVTTQTGCKDTIVSQVPIKIIATPQAIIGSTPDGCTELNVTFNGSLAAPDTSAIQWNWNFGNGNSSTLQNPPTQLYNVAGAYPISLIVSNSTGCKDTVNTTVRAFAIPKIDAGVDTTVCRGKSISIRAVGAASYSWTPTTGLSCSTCANPMASPDSITQYTVRGLTPAGCTSTDTVIVNVQQPLNISNSNGDTICTGGTARLFASGAQAYTWSPATGLSSTSIATPLAKPNTTTTYRVIGVDNKACFADTAYVMVKVYPVPTVEAGSDKTINIGQSTQLTPIVSADVNKVLWTPTQSIIQYNLPSVTVKPVTTTEYTVEVRNEGGCINRDKVTVHVICDGSNIYLPNTFSPNGDGLNDIFYPRGSGLFTIKTLRIFSRWGEVMFEKNNFKANDVSAGWNGTFKGAVLTPDVYVYTVDVICDNNVVLTLKGNVALIQ